MVAIDERLLLNASLLLYLVPLIALFTGAGMADWLLLDDSLSVDLWIAGSGIVSFLVSLWLINKAQSLWILNHYARPVVVRKV